MDEIEIDDYIIRNNGQPTRCWIKDNTMKYSRIDLTITKGIEERSHNWKIDETDYRSDHYQILMKLDINHEDRTQYEPKSGKDVKYRWHLVDVDASWRNMNIELREEWEKFQIEKIQILGGEDTNEVKADKITREIIDIYRRSAFSNFEIKKTKKIWKKLISKKAQAISIKYHKFYRWIKKTQRRRQIRRNE